MSLYQLERDGDVQGLVSVLRTSENPSVRARAAEAIGNLDDETLAGAVVTPPLVTVARETEDDAVAAAVVDALAEIGPEAVEKLVIDLAGLDLDPADAPAATKAKAYASALDASVPELRMAAATALGELGVADAAPALADATADADPRVRARAARAAGRLEDARGVDALTARLDDPSDEVRRQAALALGVIGTAGALDALRSLLDDDREIVRRIAVDALGNFEDGRPVPGLVAALGDESEAVRRTAVYSLVELLSNVPTERSHEIRASVVDRLTDTDDDTVLVPLVEIAERSSQARQRRNTVWLLGRVTDPDGPVADRVIDALVAALGDDDEFTAQFAATGLGEIGGSAVESALLGVLDDEGRSPVVRGRAAFALGRVGGPESYERLDALVETAEDDRLRQRAAAARSKLSSE